jgi:hypothetical protein
MGISEGSSQLIFESLIASSHLRCSVIDMATEGWC